jgi:hypothetical protein
LVLAWKTSSREISAGTFDLKWLIRIIDDFTAYFPFSVSNFNWEKCKGFSVISNESGKDVIAYTESDQSKLRISKSILVLNIRYLDVFLFFQ